MTPKQQEVLALFEKEPNGLTAKDVAKALGVGEWSARRQVIKLESAGYLTFRIDRGRGPANSPGVKVYIASGNTLTFGPATSFQNLLKLTIQILDAVPGSKRGPLAVKVKEIVQANK